MTHNPLAQQTPVLTLENFSPLLAQVLQEQGAWPFENCELAGKAGSDRTYFRIRYKNLSWIVSVSPHSEPDFHHFLRITQFYRLLKIPVPHVYAIDDDKRQILLEDLGSCRLYDRIQECSAQKIGVWKEGYLRAIDLLGQFQSVATQQCHECPDIYSRVFGLKDLNWEREYFLKQMVQQQLCLTLSPAALREFENLSQPLSQQVARHSLRIMHRDFQSQNLMVQNRVVRVIDYQGSRRGSCYYDVASLLFDPYICLPFPIIRELADYFFYRVPLEHQGEEAWENLLFAASQRLMQALGAYGFLSRVKKIKHFAQYTDPARKILQEVLVSSHQKKLQKFLADLGVWECDIIND